MKINAVKNNTPLTKNTETFSKISWNNFGVEKIFTSKLEELFTNNYKEMQVTLN